LLGTLMSLALTGLLALAFVAAARITGLSSEEATYLQATAGGISIQGLVLAGIVIGSLGVLNDVTVTQSSAVWEIHLANPAAPGRLWSCRRDAGATGSPSPGRSAPGSERHRRQAQHMGRARLRA